MIIQEVNMVTEIEEENICVLCDDNDVCEYCDTLDWFNCVKCDQHKG